MSIQDREDYFNNYDPIKGYRKLAFLAGRTLQSAEMNELQDNILELLKKVSRHLVSNGTILTGCEVESLSASQLVINEGTLSIEGLPTHCQKTEINLPEGLTLVGVVVTERTVTANEDAALLEPDPLSPGYLEEGAFRIQVIGNWTTSDKVEEGEAFFPVFTVKDGEILTSQSTTDMTNAINKSIARYDFSIHGSYVISGLSIQIGEVTEDNYKFLLSSGSARVSGVECEFPVETEFLVDANTDFRSTVSEPVTFSTGVLSYSLRNEPIKQITEVMATKKITANVTRGSVGGGVDILPRTPVLQILSVKQGGTIYQPNVDYVQSGDTISWTPNGAEPSPGSSYQVEFQFVANFSAYILNGSLRLFDEDAAEVVHNSVMYVDYDFYLSRIDRILLNSQGEIHVQRGTPNTPNYVLPPSVPSGPYLSLGTVTVALGADPVIDQESTVMIMSFSDLKKLRSDVDNLVYNVAQLSLKDEASALDPVTNKRGIIVDSLLNENMRDQGIDQNAVIEDTALKIGTNYLANALNSDSSFSLDSASEIVFDQQLEITKDQRINPYSQGNAPQAVISLSPGTLYANAWWRYFHGNFMPRATESYANLSLFNSGELIDVRFRGNIVSTVTADSQGKAKARIPIAVGTTLGDYDVIATGRTSRATCRAILSLKLSKTRDKGDFNWNGKEVPWGYDPVSQTFLPAVDQELSAVSIYLTELPTNTLQIKIVSTVAGIPNWNDLLGLGSVSHKSLKLGWNKINLKMPIKVIAGVEYALIVATANFQGKVATARVGEYSTATSKWVRNQTHDGVLLLSANERTWTSVQDEDLTFKLHSITYKPTKTVKVLTVNNLVDQATNFKVVADVDTPTGTSARFFMKVGSATYDLSVNEVVKVPPIEVSAGNIELWLELKTNDTKKSPKVLSGISLVYGTSDSPATYVQRQFTIKNGLVTPASLRIYLDQYEPLNSKVKVFYQLANGDFQEITNKSGTDIGFGRQTVEYKVDNLSLAATRIKIELSSTSYSADPEVKNIRTTII